MGERVLCVPIDGKIPNLALMRLAAWECEQGAVVDWHEPWERDMFTPEYDRVYASAIFDTSAKAVAAFRRRWPEAIVGGDGGDRAARVEHVVPSQFVGLDYSGYPDFTASIGYAMRGCRFNCGHCSVPEREGKPKSASAIDAIWRGPGFPKRLVLLDNDFFGNPEWRNRVREIVDGGFKVSLMQGVTARVMNAEQATAVVEMHPWDDQFNRGRLYVAWDSIDQERVYFRGIDNLERAGWKPSWVFSYMLIGFDQAETWDRIWYRYDRMVERGIRPYPMVYNKLRETDPVEWKALKRFQRWAIQGGRAKCPWEEFNPSFKRTATQQPEKEPTA